MASCASIFSTRAQRACVRSIDMQAYLLAAADIGMRRSSAKRRTAARLTKPLRRLLIFLSFCLASGGAGSLGGSKVLALVQSPGVG